MSHIKPDHRVEPGTKARIRQAARIMPWLKTPLRTKAHERLLDRLSDERDEDPSPDPGQAGDEADESPFGGARQAHWEPIREQFNLDEDPDDEGAPAFVLFFDNDKVRIDWLDDDIAQGGIEHDVYDDFIEPVLNELETALNSRGTDNVRKALAQRPSGRLGILKVNDLAESLAKKETTGHERGWSAHFWRSNIGAFARNERIILPDGRETELSCLFGEGGRPRNAEQNAILLEAVRAVVNKRDRLNFSEVAEFIASSDDHVLRKWCVRYCKGDNEVASELREYLSGKPADDELKQKEYTRLVKNMARRLITIVGYYGSTHLHQRGPELTDSFDKIVADWLRHKEAKHA